MTLGAIGAGAGTGVAGAGLSSGVQPAVKAAHNDKMMMAMSMPGVSPACGRVLPGAQVVRAVS